MSEIKKSDKRFLGKLFKHLDALLAIDKSIDFILIFVGLAAALGLENYIAQIALEQNYVDTLARIHTEIALNKPRCVSFNDGVLAHSELAFAAADYAAAGFQEPISGNSTIYDAHPEKLERKFFSTIKTDEFLNTVLLGEVYHLYAIYDHMSTSFEQEEQFMFTLSDAYTNARGRVYFGEELILEDYMPFNLAYNKATKNMGRVQWAATDAEATSVRLMLEIENELARYDITIDDARSIGDLYYLALNEMYRDSVKSEKWADEGIQRVMPLLSEVNDPLFNERKSLAGRLGRVKCELILKKADSAYWSVDSNIDEFESNLRMLEESGVYKFLHLNLGCDYWYSRGHCDELNAFLIQHWDLGFEPYEVQSIKPQLPTWRDCLDENTRAKLMEHPNIGAQSFEDPEER